MLLNETCPGPYSGTKVDQHKKTHIKLSHPLKHYGYMLAALWEWLLDQARTWKVLRDYWKMLFSKDQITLGIILKIYQCKW